jgi:hypothetical protein
VRRALALGLAVAALGGCGGSERPAAPERRTIDEEAGRYRGVGVGDSRADVKRVFGALKPDQGAGGYTPLDESDFYGPSSMSTPAPCRGPAATTQLMRYPRVVFATCRGRIHNLLVTERGAATRRGVSVGEPLDEARDAYPGLRCGDAGGGEADEYPYCTGRVGPGRYAWFGNDPIHSITLADGPMP